jgi:hypothetical protein
MSMHPSESLISEADQLVDRANLRIEQYRRHIESMERICRDSAGAALVLSRLENVVLRLCLYRDVLKGETAVGVDGTTSKALFTARSSCCGSHTAREPQRRRG